VISRAIYPADRVLTGADRGLVATDWQAAYAALREDPGEVETGAVLDASAEAPNLPPA
jgi:hypothetical protein